MGLALLFFDSFIIGFSGAMMPGPLLAVGIAETPRSGWRTGPIISVGHAIAEIAVVALLALGVAAIADQPIVTRTIAIVGGIALILMGLSMIYDTLKKRVSYEGGADNPHSHHKLAGKGITATLSNPYWFIWWATVGLALLVKSQAYGWIGPIVVYFGHILSDFVWYTLVSIVLWSGSRLIVGRALTTLLLGCAVFLLYLGGSFIYDGLTNTVVG